MLSVDAAHRGLATAETVREWQDETGLSAEEAINRVFEHLTGRPRTAEATDPTTEEERPHLFSMGQVVATPGALEALEEEGQDPMEFLNRHVRGDWGELDEQDREENELSVTEGYRLMSVYRLSSGRKVWVITEADRSATTLLLPEEY